MLVHLYLRYKCGTRARSNNKIVGIIGMEHQGICVELVETSMISDCAFDAPSLEAYKKCQTPKELGELEPDGRGVFGGSPVFIMAPFLRAAVLHAGKNEPLELIPAVIHAAEEFNRERTRTKLSLVWMEKARSNLSTASRTLVEQEQEPITRLWASWGWSIKASVWSLLRPP